MAGGGDCNWRSGCVGAECSPGPAGPASPGPRALQDPLQPEKLLETCDEAAAAGG
jgi:hypothetical protein